MDRLTCLWLGLTFLHQLDLIYFTIDVNSSENVKQLCKKGSVTGFIISVKTRQQFVGQIIMHCQIIDDG